MESNQCVNGARTALEKACALLDIGRNEAALNELATITSTDLTVLHEASLYWARACVNLGRKDEAFHHAKECIRHKPGAYQGHYMLGLVEDHRNRCAAALKSLEKARNLAPHVAVVHQRIAMVQAQLKRPIEARQAAQKALSLAPHDPESHYTAGYIELISNTGDRAIAEEALRRTLSIDPQHRHAVILLGRLRGEQTGDRSERVKALVEAQKIDPTDSVVAREFDLTFGRIMLFNTAGILLSYVLFLGISDEGLGRGLFIITAHGVCLIYILFWNLVAHIRGNPQGWKYVVKGYPRRERLFFGIFVGQCISWILMVSGTYAYLINNQVNLEPLSLISLIFLLPLPLILIIVYGISFLIFVFKAVFGPKSEE